MRTPRVLLAPLAFVGLLACEDAKSPATAPVPTEGPAEASALTPSGGPNLAQAINSQIASVCKAYRKAATQAKADLAKNPNDDQLKADVAAYDAVIDDACN